MVRKRKNDSRPKDDHQEGNGPGPQELAESQASAPIEDAASISAPQVEETEEPAGQQEVQPEPATLEGQLAQARRQAEEYLELAQRARAELINFKRRMEREQEENRRYAVESLIADLLPVMDSFAQALSSFASESDSDNPLLAGLRRTVAQFERVLRKYEVTRIGEVGIPLDAELHQPLHTEETEDVTVETVVEVYQPGVKIGDRVVRPATVKVLVPRGQPENAGPPQGEEKAPDEG